MQACGTFIVLLTALSLPAAAAGQAPTTRPAGEEPRLTRGEQLFQDGRGALLTGDYAKAIDLLRQAVEADQTKTSYRLNLARAYQYANRPAEAEAALKAILTTTADHVEAGQMLAQIYTARQSWKDVLAVLEPLLKYRHDYTTYHLLGEAAYHLDQMDKARGYFEEAIKLNARSATDHYQLGNIYLAGNFFALAAEMYQKALALGLDSPALRYKLGSAYFNLRNYFGRVQIVTVKAGKPGTISEGWYLIEPAPGSKDAFRAAPSHSAVYQIARAVADGIGDRPDIQFLMANIYLNARRYREAYDRLGKLKDTIPKEDRALYYYYFSQAAFGIGKYEEYLDLLREAIKLDKAAYEPTLVEAYLKVAEQHNQAGDLKKYIHFLEQAVAAGPQTAALHLKLGNAYEEARQYDKAVVQWRMVLDLEPDHPQRMQLLNLMARYKSQPEVPPKRS